MGGNLRRQYASWQIARLAWSRSATSFQGTFESSSAFTQKRLANDGAPSTLEWPLPFGFRRREEGRGDGQDQAAQQFGIVYAPVENSRASPHRL